MLEIYEVIPAQEMQNKQTQLTVELRFDERQKSRHKTQTTCGKELGWFIERGYVLAHGEGLQSKCGEIITVVAAKESVSEVTAENTHQLMRAAYHLGNRHVPLQVDPTKLAYLHDHVLDDMVRGLGLTVTAAQAPFTPESGAYHGTTGHGGGHSHSHGHSHDHHHDHSH